uniref:Uncharacterized protein n=1 Tax=Setaria viridis TaxID=4556 RepID=A0A4V6D3C2_SETVI|nr:hypothetical protein SEVIR_8G225600v2 [Setaria viridis]
MVVSTLQTRGVGVEDLVKAAAHPFAIAYMSWSRNSTRCALSYATWWATATAGARDRAIPRAECAASRLKRNTVFSHQDGEITPQLFVDCCCFD